jgi:hypothetical protein
MTFRAKLFHPATAIALLALVVAAGGTGWAAPLVGTANLRAGAVTKAKLAPGSVTTAKLARNSVTAVKIASGAVTATKLARNAVRGSAIVDGAVTRNKLGPLAVDTFALNLGAVRTDQLGDGAVTTAKLADAAVTAPKVADGAIAGAKIAANAITADKIADGQVVEGVGTPLASRVELANGAEGLVFPVPGFGTLSALCNAGAASFTFQNQSGTSLNVQMWSHINAAMTDTTSVARFNPGPGTGILFDAIGTGGVQTTSLQASYTDATGADHVATFDVTMGAALMACVVTAQGFTTG